MRQLLAIVALAITATPALAHHPLGGMPMETFNHGLLSGVGHPVLGFDHLFFVIAMGVAARFTGAHLLTPLAYIGSMLAGCLLMSSGVGLALSEPVVVLSLLVLGGFVLSGRALGVGAAVALFAGFGFFHGAAFGGSVAGQEGGVGGQVLLGYLLGLGVIQYGIALIAGRFAVRVLSADSAAHINARLIGAVVSGAGLFLALEMIEGPILGLITG